ncbi:MAG TPA: amidohydrolase, partial [Anaerolineales bacterium]|nr:amidohydrolase [Anaerolineales bacterium]
MSSKADLAIINARIFTSDETIPYAEAVAIEGKHILYVGNNTGAQKFCDDKTRVIDGQGHTLTAGFIDTHVHLLSGATWMGYAELSLASTKNDLKGILREYADANQSEEWIIGWRSPYNVISTRGELDEIIPDRPVYVRAADAHTAWANTKALEIAGLLKGNRTDLPDGIVLDENGLPTGELREGKAMRAVLDFIPPPSEARIRDQLKRAIQGFNRTGITSIHNMNGDMNDLMVYAAAEDAGELNLRVYVPYSVRPETREEDLSEASKMAAVQMDYVRGGLAKFFMDGVWESYTAFNIEPYADNPEISVDPIFSLEHFTRMAAACDRLGLQIAVHCCGDGAVRQTLDGYEALQKMNGRRDSRHRIEHVEVCQPEDMPRFRDLGVIAAIQPSHASLKLDDYKIGQVRLGEKRWPLWQPWRDLKNAGAHISLGSDWTVVPYDPMTHFYVALNREPYSPDSTDQRLTLAECILGYTRDAAYAEFKENEKGQVKEGYL